MGDAAWRQETFPLAQILCVHQGNLRRSCETRYNVNLPPPLAISRLKHGIVKAASAQGGILLYGRSAGVAEPFGGRLRGGPPAVLVSYQ